MSLVEVVISSALLLFVALGLLPLLARSAFNNISGLDSTQATQHARSEQESLFAAAVDDARFDLGDPMPGHAVQPTSAGVGDEMLLGDRFWDRGALAPSAAAVRVGDGAWIEDPTGAQDLVFWRRRSVIRQYAYADISDGVIDASDPNQLTTLGDARLFDLPLWQTADWASLHFREQDVRLQSQRSGGEDLGIGNLRTRIVRMF